jgi:hypothetical protein
MAAGIGACCHTGSSRPAPTRRPPVPKTSRNDQCLDQFLGMSVNQSRSPRQLRQLAHESARPMRNDRSAAARLIVLSYFDIFTQDDGESETHFADFCQRLAHDEGTWDAVRGGAARPSRRTEGVKDAFVADACANTRTQRARPHHRHKRACRAHHRRSAVRPGRWWHAARRFAHPTKIEIERNVP